MTVKELKEKFISEGKTEKQANLLIGKTIIDMLDNDMTLEEIAAELDWASFQKDYLAKSFTEKTE